MIMTEYSYPTEPSPEFIFEQGLMDYLRGDTNTVPIIQGDDAFLAARTLRIHDYEISSLLSSTEPTQIELGKRVLKIELEVEVEIEKARLPGILDNSKTPSIPGNTSGNAFLSQTIGYYGSLGGGTPSNPLRVGH